MFLSILESGRHRLLTTLGLILVTPSLRGCEAFPTPEALTYTRIALALSLMAPQVVGDTRGAPCAHDVRALLMERCVTTTSNASF
jgi:hypothetical protein